MININLTEHSVFTYVKETSTIRIHDHEEGRYAGKVQEHIGEITFCDREQAHHFKEMLDLMLESKDE